MKTNFLKFIFFTIIVTSVFSCSKKQPESDFGDIIIENSEFRLVIGANARAKSLLHKPSLEECLKMGCNTPVSTLTQYRPYDNELFLTYPSKQKIFNADTIYWKGKDLVVGFELETYLAIISVNITDDYIAFELKGFDYKIENFGVKRKTEIDEFTLLQLPIRDRGYFGEWLNVSWDNNIAVSLLATGPYTKIDAEARDGYHIMQAGMQANVKLINVGAALITTTKKRLLSRIDKLEADYKLPRGVQSRQREEYKYSYYEPRNVTTQNIDEHIKFAKQGGFHSMVIYYRDFAASMGHFTWRPEYPNGMADLQEITHKIQAAGMITGFHIHYNKASKNDSYVSPVPDARLNLSRNFTLASQVGIHTTVINIEENPEGCTMEDGRRFLKIGNELITYENYTIVPPYQFTGCRRGELGTQISNFNKGFKLGLLDVDTWPLFVRFDQNTSIQKEVAKRIGKICVDAGFKFIYFDGAEDVHPPYWYTVSKSQLEVYNCLNPKPLFSEGAAKSHFSWHILTRGNAFDFFPPEVIKEATKKYQVSAAKYIAQDFSSINFGWLNYLAPSDKTIGMQPDMYEYVCSRATSWDCPISLRGKLDQLKLHPRTADNLEVICRWEKARIQNYFTEEQKENMKNLEQEHILLINEKGDFELTPYTQINNIADGSKNIRAFIFNRKNKTWVVYWHTSGEGILELPINSDKISLFEKLGTELPVLANNEKTTIPIGKRRYIQFDLPQKEVVDLFSKAKIRYND